MHDNTIGFDLQNVEAGLRIGVDSHCGGRYTFFGNANVRTRAVKHRNLSDWLHCFNFEMYCVAGLG